MTGDLTHDAFLCGKLHLWQPKQGYRAATDAVLLAAACPAKAGQSVLDLGCGVGAASLCLASRVAGLVQTGLELQEDYAALARQNAAENGVALNVAMDLEPYARINPCGYAGLQSVDLSTIGVSADWAEVADLLSHKLIAYLTP